MRQRKSRFIMGATCLVFLFALVALSQVEGKERAYMRIGNKILVNEVTEDGPERKPILNRETLSTLELTKEQQQKIQAINASLYEKYPGYEATWKEIQVLEEQSEKAKDGIEGWGRIKKELETAITGILTDEQIAALHPGKGGPPKGKGKRKIHWNRLDQIELTEEQQALLDEELASFDTQYPGYSTAFRLELTSKAKIKELEKGIEEAEEEFKALVLGILTEAQISELPLTGPPEDGGPPAHAQNEED